MITVIPAQAGIQYLQKIPRYAGPKPHGTLIKPLDSRLRGNDELLKDSP